MCCSVGSGFFEPAMNALVNNSAGLYSQGRIQGASQALQSITRIIGPLTAALRYGYGAGVPSIVSAMLTLAGIGLLFAFKASWTASTA